jgi:hypothetical protein
MAGDIGKGIFGGAVSGASSGAAFGPWGAGAGALIGGIGGFMQGKQAKKLDKAYQDSEKNIQVMDPLSMARLAQLRQQERNFRAGTDASSGFAAQQARNVAAQTQSNLMRAGGPGLVGNQLRSQQALGTTIAGIGANAASGANQILGMQGGLIDRLSERQYQRQRELRNIAMSRATAARQDINNQFAGALASLPQMGMQFGGPKAAGGMSGSSFNPFTPANNPVGSYDVNFPVQNMTPRLPQAAPLSYQPLG